MRVDVYMSPCGLTNVVQQNIVPEENVGGWYYSQTSLNGTRLSGTTVKLEQTPISPGCNFEILTEIQ